MGLQFDKFMRNRANFVEPDSLLELNNNGRLTAGLFKPAAPPAAVLVFYHGGGASMGGYGGLADRLRNAGIAVLTPDIRGHGRSCGKRGFAASPRLVWSDVEAALAWAERSFPGIPLFVGGHSSGGGMVINWAKDRTAGWPAVQGLVLLTPFAGTRLQKPIDARAGEAPFITARLWVILAYLLSGRCLMRHAEAVRFSYPRGIRDSRALVHAYSPGMTLAVTPRKALAALRTITLPMLIVAARDDELLDTDRLRDASTDRAFTTVEGTHLSCFIAAAEPIGHFIRQNRPAQA